MAVPIKSEEEKKSVYKSGPRRVTQVTFQAEIFWPGGKFGSVVAIKPADTFYKKLKMLMIPGVELLLEWEDGSQYSVPVNNIKGAEYEK